MRARIAPDGVWLKRLFGRERLVRFDQLDPAQLPPEVARELAPILAGPALDGTLAGMGAALEAWLSGPHGARTAAEKLLAAAQLLFATDLHLEPLATGGQVRVRIEGVLAPLCRLPDARPLVAALKGLAGCLPYRSDIVQEGRIPRAGVASDVRASFVPAALGERVALRLFGRLRSLDELGLESAPLAAVRELLSESTGLVLIAGATGAGKTTTIYAALRHLAEVRPGAHLSLEDPVEQRLRIAGVPVDQIELDPARGLSGEAMLAAALRQDVDVLAVGELRTPAEAALAVRAAHTGRLVLAGVHAGSCDEAKERLRDLGVEERMVETTLRGVLHQELLVEPCACGSGCASCGGIGRRRRLRARVAAPLALLGGAA